MNWLLCETLSTFSPPPSLKKPCPISGHPSQEEQIEYARSLRMLKAGWTTETRTSYLQWFLKAASYRGGASFDKFIEFIRNDALATFTEEERRMLAPLIEQKPIRKSALENVGGMFVGRELNDYKLNELVDFAQRHLPIDGSLIEGIKQRDLEKGRKLFGAAACYSCHRFGNEGGMNGPDLTSAARRYSIKDFGTDRRAKQGNQ